MTGRVLVVGAGGQVGGAVCAALGRRAVGTWRTPPPGGLSADLEELAARPSRAEELVARAAPGAVVVAAGMTWVDGCERQPALADAVNRDGPAALARAAATAGARTVYLSTEYVFDGRDGPYDEDRPITPLSAYGRSKAEGEGAVREADPDALVVRTTVVYGPEAHGRNFAYQLAARLGRGEAMPVPADQVSSPTYNPDLAAALVGLLDAGTRGVVNVAGPEVMDRVAFARRLATAMGLDAGLVVPRTTAELGQEAPRPLDAGLEVGRLRRLLPGLVLRAPEEAVAHWAATAPPVPWTASGSAAGPR
jgi:dTDP-4-dehydrorhamnose reductase